MSQVQPEGYLALPPSGKGSAVLVLHAWWGLNDTIKAFCRRLAEAGFIAFAPDLYHGKVTDTIAGAEELGRALDMNFLQAKAEVAGAATFLKGHAGADGIAVVAFSLGVYYALDLATSEPEGLRSIVIFYGSSDADFTNAKASFLGHFAESDEYEPQSNIDNMENEIKRVGRPVSFYSYPGTGHWFFEPDHSDAYNEEAASLAWDRTLAFLKRSATT